jgi:5-formyltetrahydrofolate cyclo-ligase
LGFGGGYYDRFLPTTPALRVGVAYAECLADTLPCDESDQRMDWIATPAGLFATGAPRRDGTGMTASVRYKPNSATNKV